MRVSKQDILDWEQHVARVRSATTVDPTEPPGEQRGRIARAKADYAFFFATYFPHYAEREAGNPSAGLIPCSKFQVEGAGHLKENPKGKLAMEWYRSSAKSVHSNIGYGLWLMVNDEMNFEVLVSDTEKKACVLLSAVQAELEYNERFIHDFGKQVSHGDWADGYFATRQGKMFAALGIGQSPRGLRRQQHRPDYIVVDDADTKERCRNPRRVREAVEWVTDDLMGCFDSKDDSRERFVICNNRIHKNSILTGVVAALKGIMHSVVNALGADGLPTWPEKTSLAYWLDKESKVPYRSFQREFMNNPIEDGAIFKEEWFRWKKMLPLQDYDDIISYGDLSYRKTGDFKAIVVMGRAGKELHIIKVFCRQCGIDDAVVWLYDFHESLPEDVTMRHYIEGNFIQDGFLDDFEAEGDKRGYYLGVIADKRAKPDKFLRIENASAFWNRGIVWYNVDERDSPDMVDANDQTLAFEQGSGANDDAPDAKEGALWLLNRSSSTTSFKPIIGTRGNIISRFFKGNW